MWDQRSALRSTSRIRYTSDPDRTHTPHTAWPTSMTHGAPRFGVDQWVCRTHLPLPVPHSAAAGFKHLGQGLQSSMFHRSLPQAVNAGAITDWEPDMHGRSMAVG